MFTGIGLEFVLRGLGGVDLTITETLREIRAEKSGITHCMSVQTAKHLCLSYNEKRSIIELFS